MLGEAGYWLGFDTGGTFTDAVLLAGGRHVVASAKALTTPWDLAIGIGNALRAVLEHLPAGASRADVTLVSVSTTLATNAVVENRFSPVCTLLIGFDDAMVERSRLRRDGGGWCAWMAGTARPARSPRRWMRRRGAAVSEFDARVEAFAVAANFSVRNPAHELRARQLIRSLSKSR